MKSSGLGKDMKSGAMSSKSSGAAPPSSGMSNAMADEKGGGDEEPGDDESPMFRVVKLEFRPTKDQGQIVHMAGTLQQQHIIIKHIPCNSSLTVCALGSGQRYFADWYGELYSRALECVHQQL